MDSSPQALVQEAPPAEASPSPSATDDSLRVDVGGREVVAECSGPTGPGPVVLFEAGLGDQLRTWRRVRPQLSDLRTCAYNRAGLGGSDGLEVEQVTLDDWAADLRAVIAAVSPEQPVILVGHSIGGSIVRRVAATTPELVVGLVLVDPTPDRWMLEVTRSLGEAGVAVDPVAVGQAGLDSPGLGDIPTVIYTTSITGDSRFAGQLETAGLTARGLVVVSDSEDHVLQIERPDSVARLVRVVVEVAGGGQWPSCESLVEGTDDGCPPDGA